MQAIRLLAENYAARAARHPLKHPLPGMPIRGRAGGTVIAQRPSHMPIYAHADGDDDPRDTVPVGIIKDIREVKQQQKQKATVREAYGELAHELMLRLAPKVPHRSVYE